MGANKLPYQAGFAERETALPVFHESGSVPTSAVLTPEKAKQVRNISNVPAGYFLFSQVEYRTKNVLTVANEAVTGLEYNENRKSLYIQNTGIVNVLFSFTPIIDTNTGIILNGGENISFPYPTALPVYIFCTIGSVSVRFMEGV